MTDAFANRLRKNLAHWKKWARRRGISCFRLYDRDIPQFPFVIDCYETVSPRAETHLHVVGVRDRKSTRLNSSHTDISRMPSSA